MSVDPNVQKPPVAGLALTEHDALPAGTRFGEFEIIRALGVGGFGIVYLAQDHSLERQVALKEYMPAALASRGDGAMVRIRASSFADTYAVGLRSFINEARLLARFDHPSLVKVYRFWEDNGTAYMVMPYLPGRTLRDARRALGGAPDEIWIRTILDPMLDALELLHSEGVFHRDIAPDNIVLSPDGVPILLDFGAARRVISDRTQSLTAILKPSYAPIEQYAEMAAMRQGPWTDIYALGAVLHYLMFGVPPAPATARAVQADTEHIEQRVVPGVSPRFMSVVAWMLGVRPLERPQSVATVRAAMNGELTVPSPVRHDVTLPMVAKVPAAVFTSTAVEASRIPTVSVAAMAMGRAVPEEAVLAPTEIATRRVEPEAADKALAEAPPRHPAPVSTAAAAVVPTPRSTSVAAGAGGAPLRSTPPGTTPPSYVPLPRPPKPKVEESALPPRVAPPITPQVASRPRRLAMAGGLGAVALTAALIWQFIGVVGQTGRGATATSRAASVQPVPPPSASAARPDAAVAARATEPPSAPSAPSAPAEDHGPAVAAVMPDSNRAGEVAPVALLPPVAEPAEAAGSQPQRGSRPARSSRHPTPARKAPLVAAGPSSARQACGGRNFISAAMCIDRQCEQPRYRESSECLKVAEARRRRAGNY